MADGVVSHDSAVTALSGLSAVGSVEQKLGELRAKIAEQAKEAKREQWRQLEDILRKVNSFGLSSLEPAELKQFGMLYRRASADLSRARTEGLNPELIAYLNGLVGRAYAHIYTTESQGFFSLPRFLAMEFPASVRRNGWFCLTAAFLFAAAALIAFLLTAADEHLADALLGVGATDQLRQLALRHEGNKDWLPLFQRPFTSSIIILNNIGVSMRAFAVGIPFGLGTMFFMVINGLFMGCAAGVVHHYGVSIYLWSFVLPHGVIELPAIFIAGGAGLRLGYTLINPGDYTRLTALRLAARDVVQMLLGVGLLLVIAGLIEGFLSPVPTIPPPAKFGFAALVGTALFVYLTFSGSNPKRS